MKKIELRKLYLEKRKALSEVEIEYFSQQILQQFLAYFNLSEIHNIHIFLPIRTKKEVNTWYFIHYFWKLNKHIFAPKILDNNLLHYPIDCHTPLQENHWGILEPQGEPTNTLFDTIIIPLLYADNEGNRIGYGKGFYDRFLKKMPYSMKIGVNFFPPKEIIDNVENTDIPLDYLVCPNEVFSFKSKSTK